MPKYVVSMLDIGILSYFFSSLGHEVVATKVNSLGPETRRLQFRWNNLTVVKQQYDMKYRLAGGCLKSPKVWLEQVDLAKGSRLGILDIQPCARPRRLRDSIVGFMTEHGLLFNADKLRSWISWEVLKLNRCSRQILQQYLSGSIDTCWKKRHDVQPDLGNYGTALTSESDANIQSSHWHQHASNCLASGDHDRSCMRQPVRTIESLQVQHASRAIGKRHESAWEVWGSKHLWHLLGSRGFGSWNLWKPRLRSYEMLSYAGFSLLLSRRPVRAKCPWGNPILEISDIKSTVVIETAMRPSFVFSLDDEDVATKALFLPAA